MSGTFSFCPDSLVAETLPPEPVQGTSMNGWTFTSKPKVPFQKKFRVTLHGLRWVLQADGTYDTTTTPTINARVLEQFYQSNQTWDSFTWAHPHLGSLTCRFAEPVTIPASLANSNGYLDPVEVVLVQHDPGY